VSAAELSKGPPSARRQIATAALVIMVGNVASRLLGLVREQVMAWLFGATGATDAFVAASAVPTMVYDLLVGGAISAALVPVFVEAAQDEARLWRLVSAIFNLAGLALLGVAALLALLADPLIDVLGAGFAPEQHAAAVGMVRVMLAAVVLQGLAGVLMAVLYARQRFALPAFAPAVYNGGIILLALLLHGSLGVAALVAGVLAGAAGQLLLQLGGLRALRYYVLLDLGLPEVRAILRLYAPVAAGMVVTIAGITVDRYLASQLEAGSMTVMGYATRLIQFPLGLVATATAFAVLPTLAKHAGGMRPAPGPADPGGLESPPRLAGRAAETTAGDADFNLQSYRQTLGFGIKIILLLMLPATLGLSILREPLVRLLFEHRAFTSYDTLRTATVFLFYAPQLPFTALDQLLIFAFYARRDTVTPVVVGVLTVGCYVLVALATRGPLGVGGLALANAVQNSLHGLILLALLWRAVGGLGAGDLLQFGGRILLAASAMALALWLTLEPLGPLLSGSRLGTPGLLLLELAVGLAVYAAAVVALRVPEARQLFAAGLGPLTSRLSARS
jgi:putative peptidoglycan lipid II flippase